jgi:hypothetical protein
MRKQGWQTFPVKGQREITLGFAGLIVSLAATQLCHFTVKAALDRM